MEYRSNKKLNLPPELSHSALSCFVGFIIVTGMCLWLFTLAWIKLPVY